VVVSTDCIDSCKFNYHMNMATMTPEIGNICSSELYVRYIHDKNRLKKTVNRVSMNGCFDGSQNGTKED